MTENTDYDAYCNLLYQDLAARACTPTTETDGAGPSINENGVFFPAGTAEEVLSIRRLEHIFNHVLRSGSPACRNISGTAVDLAQSVVARKLQKFVAVMLVVNCDLKAMITFTTSLVEPRVLSEDKRSSSRLPVINFAFARSILGSDATTALFLEKQYEFLAPVIKKYEEVKGDFRRVPYVREKLIGQGSFGMVYEVEISPHHFEDEIGLFNSGNLVLARKDFVLNAWDKAYDKEREVLREIVRNVRKNENIMESWGSLEFGTTYSLFMPLADCDLMKYMESRTPPQSIAEKVAFVKCAVDLSGAIAFLHDQLESPFYEKLSCFHMDLKPQNILVVIHKGEQIWKVSDFNMSSVKGSKRNFDKEHLQLNRGTTFYDINKLFRQEKRSTAASSSADSTINRRGAGTYLAPEACIGDAVQAECDIWSLGCVISVVFTYMCEGFAGVEEFSKMRSRNSHNGTDCFFTLPQKKLSPKIGDLGLNDGVLRWLKHLRTTQPTIAEKAILEDLTRFLAKHVFVIDPIRRRKTTADQIRYQLIAAYNAYRQTPEPQEERTAGPRLRSGIIGSLMPSRGSPLPVSRPIRLDIALDSPLTACVLGSSAHLLVCVTPTKLAAYRILDITSQAAIDNLDEYGNVMPCNGQLWSKHVVASTRYIIAATDSEQFEFYLYSIDQFGLSEMAHRALNFPRIHKLAISADEQYAAFVVQSSFRGASEMMLYIAHLDTLLSMQTDRLESITSSVGVQSRSSSSRVQSMISSSGVPSITSSSGVPSIFSLSRVQSTNSSSSVFSSEANSILGRPIPIKCSADDIYDMVFSETNVLYIVSKPKRTGLVRENAMTVYAWNVVDGRRIALRPVIIAHKGNDDLSHGLFTSFAPYSQTPGFTVVTEKTRIMSHAWSTNFLPPSSTGRYRILHIFWYAKDRTLLALGTEQMKSVVHLLAITNVAKRDDPKFQSLATFPDLRQESITPGLFGLSVGDSTEQHCLFITIIDADTVRLFRVPLPLSYDGISRVAEKGNRTVVGSSGDMQYANPNLNDMEALTQLSWEAEKKNEETVRPIPRRGNIEVDAKGANSRTPLSWAAEKQDREVADTLLYHDRRESPTFPKGTDWFPELAVGLTSETWTNILERLPKELGWDLEYTEPYKSRPCWTLTPSSSTWSEAVPVPLTLARAPVVVPVPYVYNLRPALTPPSDPHPERISPGIPLQEKVIDSICKTFDDPLGFYVLVNGWLQIIVDEKFNFSYALSHRPHTFGGLRVSYIQRKPLPSASRLDTSLTVESDRSSSRDEAVSESCSGGTIEAKVTRSRRRSDRFQGRIGVVTEFDRRFYVTVPTHLMTEAWLSVRRGFDLDESWKQDVTLHSPCGSMQGARICKTFDPDPGVFPKGFQHDTSLVDVTESRGIRDALACSQPTDWLKDHEWNNLKFRNSSTLHLLGDVKGAARSIPCWDSETSIIGQAIFNSRRREARKSIATRVYDLFRGSEGSSGDATLEDWNRSVAHALLFRVKPGTYTVSGTAVCVHERQDDGSSSARVAGFTSFVQDVSQYNSLSMDDETVRHRLRNGNLSFYGAFRAPQELMEHHSIVQRSLGPPN